MWGEAGGAQPYLQRSVGGRISRGGVAQPSHGGHRHRGPRAARPGRGAAEPAPPHPHLGERGPERFQGNQSLCRCDSQTAQRSNAGRVADAVAAQGEEALDASPCPAPKALVNPSRSATVTVSAEWPLRRNGEGTFSAKWMHTPALWFVPKLKPSSTMDPRTPNAVHQR